MPEIESQLPFELLQQFLHYFVDLGASLTLVIPILHQGDRRLRIAYKYFFRRNDLYRFFCFHITLITYSKRQSSGFPEQNPLRSTKIANKTPNQRYFLFPSAFSRCGVSFRNTTTPSNTSTSTG